MNKPPVPNRPGTVIVRRGSQGRLNQSDSTKQPSPRRRGTAIFGLRSKKKDGTHSGNSTTPRKRSATRKKSKTKSSSTNSPARRQDVEYLRHQRQQDGGLMSQLVTQASLKDLREVEDKRESMMPDKNLQAQMRQKVLAALESGQSSILDEAQPRKPSRISNSQSPVLEISGPRDVRRGGLSGLQGLPPVPYSSYFITFTH